MPLKSLFYVCTGIGPKKQFPALSHKPHDVKSKLYWKHSWRRTKGIWANPDNVPKDQRYIRFSPKHLEGARLDEEVVYDSEKILVSRSTNRNSQNPIAAILDTTGLCPTKDVFCIVPRSIKGNQLLLCKAPKGGIT
ncbi:MAG: hypothetical protein R2932_04585 [Caldilineaceae bacterium]